MKKGGIYGGEQPLADRWFMFRQMGGSDLPAWDELSDASRRAFGLMLQQATWDARVEIANSLVRWCEANGMMRAAEHARAKVRRELDGPAEDQDT